MKRLFNIALTLCAAITLSTSCGVNEETEPLYQSFGTLLETPAGSRAPYYILFDDGKSAYVTNTGNWSPTFSATAPELRYLINYQITSQNSIGYDYEIEIISVKECMPTQYYLPTVTADSFTGDNGLQNYKGGASVEACFISPATNYMTLMVYYNVANEFTTTPPEMVLVQNTAENSPYKDLYEDDNYLYLELYHDDTDYSGMTQYTTNLSCKIQTGIQNLMNSYSGVKIISINHNTEQVEVKTFNFTTEGQQ